MKKWIFISILLFLNLFIVNNAAFGWIFYWDFYINNITNEKYIVYNTNKLLSIPFNIDSYTYSSERIDWPIDFNEFKYRTLWLFDFIIIILNLIIYLILLILLPIVLILKLLNILSVSKSKDIHSLMRKNLIFFIVLFLFWWLYFIIIEFINFYNNF